MSAHRLAVTLPNRTPNHQTASGPGIRHGSMACSGGDTRSFDPDARHLAMKAPAVRAVRGPRAIDVPCGLGASAPSLFAAGASLLPERNVGLTRTPRIGHTRLSLA